MRLLNDILDLSKIEANRMELECAEFNVHDAVIDTIRVLGVTASRKGVDLICRIAPDLPAQIRGDSVRLQQVLINLLGNAIKFTDQGEIYVDVSCQSRSSNSCVLHLLVRDTGIGIPAEKQQRIFESFAQADASTTRRFGGTGLGLAISSRLAQLMGGRLWVESEEGRGSTFHCTAKVEWVSQSPPHTELLLVESDADQRPRILLLDSQATSRQTYQEQLVSLGWAVTSVADVKRSSKAIRHDGSELPFEMVVIVGSVCKDSSAHQLANQLSQTINVKHLPALIILPPGGHEMELDKTRWRSTLSTMGPIHTSQLRQCLDDARWSTLDQPSTGSAPPSSSLSSSSPSLSQPPAELKILLAEDCDINREVAIGLLQLQGHVVEVAENGREAVEKVMANDYDIVLMDVEMPEMNGLEAARIIRQQPTEQTQQLPIVAMTAHDTRDIQIACQHAGMNGYVTKPIDPANLYATITAHAGGHKGSNTLSISR